MWTRLCWCDLSHFCWCPSLVSPRLRRPAIGPLHAWKLKYTYLIGEWPRYCMPFSLLYVFFPLILSPTENNVHYSANNIFNLVIKMLCTCSPLLRVNIQIFVSFARGWMEICLDIYGWEIFLKSHLKSPLIKITYFNKNITYRSLVTKLNEWLFPPQ